MKDSFQREIDYLRLSVTDNCNLRCIYCMEEDQKNFLEKDTVLKDDEIIRILKASATLGIKKIRITGGEPLVRPGIVDLVSKINNIKGIEEIYITTNGILLEDKVEALSKSGIKGVNISLDSLKEERFNSITRIGSLNKVLNAIDKSIEYGIKVKLNVVMIEGINSDEILDFINLTIDKPIDVRFIELMPIGIGRKYKGVSNENIRKLIDENYPKVNLIKKGNSEGPAKYVKIDGALGKVGFISAMSNCFCEECNRIRITSDGFLKQCLHFNFGVNLKNLIKDGITDEELKEVIKENIYNKPEKHLFNKESVGKELKFMNEIGG